MDALMSDEAGSIVRKIKENAGCDIRDMFQQDQGDRKNIKQDFTPDCICDMVAKLMKKAGMSKVQLKSAVQIESMTKEMDALVGKHTKRPSKWSGNIDFLDGSEGYCAAKE